MYWSAVPRTRETDAEGAGDLGYRALPVRDDGLVRESDDVVRAPSTSPAMMTVDNTVDGDTPNVPWAHPDRRSTEQATMPPG